MIKPFKPFEPFKSFNKPEIQSSTPILNIIAPRFDE